METVINKSCVLLQLQKKSCSLVGSLALLSSSLVAIRIFLYLKTLSMSARRLADDCFLIEGCPRWSLVRGTCLMQTA